VLVEEVKLGCTLAMLTCLDREHRLAYVLGRRPGPAAPRGGGILRGPGGDLPAAAVAGQARLEAFTNSFCGLCLGEGALPLRSPGRPRRAARSDRARPSPPRPGTVREAQAGDAVHCTRLRA
jgi:hypothetical protein